MRGKHSRLAKKLLIEARESCLAEECTAAPHISDDLQMLAISSGSTVKLWDHNNSDDPTSYQPLGHTVSSLISDISWSPDGSRLAACSHYSSASTAAESNIAITPIKNDDSKSLILSVPNASSVSLGGHNSRYLCASIGNAVAIYDLEDSIQTRLFPMPPIVSNWKHDNISSKAYILSDSKVAAASSVDGSLYLYNMKSESDTSMVPSRLCPSSNDELVGCSALCFVANQTTAAVGMNNGSIYVWDIEQESLSCSIDTSTISADGINDMCFSPVNELLLASCSTDRLYFHDSKSSKPIETIDLSADGNSLSLSGVNCAVSTKSGVLIYDLRKLSSPITEWKTATDGKDESQYQEPITCVRYQPTNQPPLGGRSNRSYGIIKDKQPGAHIHSPRNNMNAKPASIKPVV